jgi:hypothetical protein
MATKEEIVFSEALRGLELQDRLYGELKSAGGFAVTAAALSAGFLGRDAATIHGPLFWAGVAAFASVFAAVIGIYRTRDWKAVFDSKELVSYVDHGIAVGTMLRDLAIWAHENYNDNDAVLRQMRRLLTVGFVGLGVEVTAFLLNLVVK